MNEEETHLGWSDGIDLGLDCVRLGLKFDFRLRQFGWANLAS